MKLNIQTACDTDNQAIDQLIQSVFKDASYSEQTEHLIVQTLRTADQLSLSLVAKINDEVVGHIAASPVAISDHSQNWYGLGPLSVHPDYQQHGIGSALVENLLQTLKRHRAAGCVVLGEPSYYRRFGFSVHKQLWLEGVPSDYFQAISFEDKSAEGEVKYHQAFYETYQK